MLFKFNPRFQYFILYIEQIVSISENSTFSHGRITKKIFSKEIYNYFFPLKNFLSSTVLFWIAQTAKKD